MDEKTTSYRHKVLALVFVLLLSRSLSNDVQASESEFNDAEVDAIEDSVRSWCPKGSSAPTYDAYPGTAPYPERAAGPGDEWSETFNEYADNEIVECASGKSLRPHLDVSSQCLRKQTISDGRTGYAASVEHALLDLPRGLEYRKIRAVTFSLDPHGKRVLWTNQEHRIRLYLSSLDKQEPGEESDQGMSMYARYRTTNDHYVASLKTDGGMFIKQKLCKDNNYILLKDDTFGSPVSTKNWYNLVFRAEDVKHPATGAPGVKLTFTVTRPSDDYKKTLTTTHYARSRFPNGTGGFRTDFIRGYVDDWRVRF
ncbi:hypothetical protein C8R31_10295 [Nitrosospira sp. Nsp2]|uniref:hypothetical protein n=1 Tax=Nitrosospira sp. Nsp2 TaxID=136548 RepID=UPI000D312EFB|nr:hypothetical protein [Nitrosospira sp. Nsp2]PTR16081.1 hypothetical protein C8R31_10295 [Nitrosospira sp. Nsp2]